MGKVSYHFLTCLFNAFLIYILLINFTGWSGAYMDIVGQTTTADWSNSYFGFQSLQKMLSTANTFFSMKQFSISSLLDDLNKLTYVITFGLPKLLSGIATGNLEIKDILQLVVNLLVQPLALIYYVFKVLAYIVTYLIFILTLLLQAFAGQYNIPFDNIPDYHPSSLVIPPVLASGFML